MCACYDCMLRMYVCVHVRMRECVYVYDSGFRRMSALAHVQLCYVIAVCSYLCVHLCLAWITVCGCVSLACDTQDLNKMLFYLQSGFYPGDGDNLHSPSKYPESLAMFGINSTSGVLFSTVPLDYESGGTRVGRRPYALTVFVSPFWCSCYCRSFVSYVSSWFCSLSYAYLLVSLLLLLCVLLGKKNTAYFCLLFCGCDLHLFVLACCSVLFGHASHR